jgi:hypothetical protein
LEVDGIFLGPKTYWTERDAGPRYTLEIKCFSEVQVEHHLAELLRAYRAFHLEPDEAEPPHRGNADGADKSRRFFQAFFADQLASAGNEGFLLHSEEEDALNVFSKWTRQNLRQIPCELRRERFQDLEECFERIATLPAAALIKGVK